MAKDQFVYETIRPRFLAVDPADFITINDAATRNKARSRLINAIWGEAGIPLTLLPDTVHQNVQSAKRDTADCDALEYRFTILRLKCQLSRYDDWPHLAGIDELRTRVGPFYSSSIAYFRPKSPNGTLVIYQNGYASTYHHQHRHIQRLVEKGFTVAAANLLGYGDNFCGDEQKLRDWYDSVRRFERPLPMRAYFSPLVAAVNHSLQQGDISQVAMIGLSAGGWLTTVMAAVDTRIRLSYPVAGFMPPFLQEPNERPPIVRYEPLFEAASMLDQFILGADLANRHQVQFFNRYDRCCYANKRALIYEPQISNRVEALKGGTFQVRIDETHARHKISRWTFDSIIRDIREHSQK